MEKVTLEEKKDNIYGARYVAVRLLNRYERSDSYVDKLLEYEHKNSKLNPLDKSLLTELVNGVIRWRGKLDWILTGFYRGDFQKCLNIVKNAMRVALYQILFLNKIPVPSAINESVEIVKRIQSEKTAGIVNGVLRNIVRNLDNVRYPEKDHDIIYYFSVLYSHPKWMVKRWVERYGEKATEKLLVSNNHRPNLPVRVLGNKINVDEITDFLQDNGITFYRTPYLREALRLKNLKHILLESKYFEDGKVVVQDVSSSLVPLLANPKSGDYLVDLCSAPGGKTMFSAQLMNNEGRILAVEKYQSKLRFIQEASNRLGFDIIETKAADATELELEELADVVMADVPCSGLGTLSKHADIKWKREPEDIDQMVKLQREIMDNAAKLVKPGGAFVYSTCSIEPQENQDNAKWFLENHPEFELDPADKYLHHEVCTDGFYLTLPHVNNCDGAFAARFIKKAE